MSNKVYDIINKIQRFLPTLGGFYLVLVAAWGLPYGEPINKTIVGLAGVLAVFLEIWTGVWKNKGNTIEVHNISQDLANIGMDLNNLFEEQSNLNNDDIKNLVNEGDIENVQDKDISTEEVAETLQ